MTSKYSIDIRWDWSRESFIFNAGSPPKVGQKFTTSETWPGDDNLLVIYSARVIDYMRHGTKHQLQLEYSLQDNPDLEIHDLCWGTSVIRFDTNGKTCSATWQSCPADVRYDGRATGRIAKLSTEEDLEYISNMRIKRKQQQFKGSLFKHTRTCELTGESVLCALDAAHITNVSNRGSYSADNGLLLRTDIHRLFDNDLLRISARDGSAQLAKGLPKNSKYHDLLKGLKLSRESLARVRSNLKKRNASG